MSEVNVPAGHGAAMLLSAGVARREGQQFFAPDWAATIAWVVDRTIKARKYDNYYKTVAAACDRCRQDPDAALYLKVILVTMADEDEDWNALQKFASASKRTIRCRCGQSFRWPDLYQAHKSDCTD